MRKKIFLSLITFFSIAANAQSVSLLKYSLQKGNTSAAYAAFFVRNDDGTGIIRVKYTSPINAENVLVEMDVQEEFPDIKEGKNDNKLFYRLTAPKFISGNGKENFEPPVLWFKRNPVNNEYEPLGITATSADTDTTIVPFSSITFLENKDLKKDLVLEYFTPQDIFFKNLFETGTRDLSTVEKNTKIILLVVANINEPEIGPSCLNDMNRTVETFTKLADFMKIKLDYKAISGKEYNKENVEKELRNLSPKPNDIVVFYYSGHGFRKPKDSRRFPYIDLRPKPDKTYMVNSLNIEDIFDSIKKKGARLNLVMSDCCNTEVTASNAIGTPIPRKKGLLMTYNLENCRALFLNPKPISVLATAADVGQKAASNNDFGGFFSYFFKASMENQLSFFKKNVTWESLLQDAKKQTIIKAEHTYCSKPYIPENICEQYPVWK
ncbi:MAG: caspase family protein [Chitinophagaceae bacterium]|nr:caspase family protein [Chitinophagaceae bacterium]